MWAVGGCYLEILPPCLYKQEMHLCSGTAPSHLKEARHHWAPEPLHNHIPDCPGSLASMEQQRKQQQRGKLQRVLREQKARLYIIRRCVVMLLCWSDWSQAWWTCVFFFCYFFFPILFTLPLWWVDDMIYECSLFTCFMRKARLLNSPCKETEYC